MDLLDKTRKINLTLQKTMSGSGISYNELAKQLSDVIVANVFIITMEGTVIGTHLTAEFTLNTEDKFSNLLPSDYQEKLSRIEQPIANVEYPTSFSMIPPLWRSMFPNMKSAIIPVHAGGSRIGTLVLQKVFEDFGSEDLILAEMGATIVGMKIVRQRTERIESEFRDKTFAKIALSSLSYSEQIAIEKIMEQLDAKEGLLVASQLADQAGLTRSVIVNALRKLASAGVLESRSLGMKGTYIKILNDKFKFELERLKSS